MTVSLLRHNSTVGTVKESGDVSSRGCGSDSTDVTCCGRLFQTRAMLLCHVYSSSSSSSSG